MKVLIENNSFVISNKENLKVWLFRGLLILILILFSIIYFHKGDFGGGVMALIPVGILALYLPYKSSVVYRVDFNLKRLIKSSIFGEDEKDISFCNEIIVRRGYFFQLGGDLLYINLVGSNVEYKIVFSNNWGESKAQFHNRFKKEFNKLNPVDVKVKFID
jgi:hypothetical protein